MGTNLGAAAPTTPSYAAQSRFLITHRQFPRGSRSILLPLLRRNLVRSNLVSSLRASAEQAQSSRVRLPFPPQNSIETPQEACDPRQAHVAIEAGHGDGGAWTLPPVQHDVGVTLMVLAGGWAWVRLFDFLTEQKYLGQKLSRKLVHITSGLLFAASWPLYSSFPGAQYLAALVPVSNGIRLLVYGLGFLKDEGLVKSVSREGDPRELLRGPLYYVVVLVFSTVLFWRDSPVGVMALAMMCGGDGIADIVGRRFGSSKLPYNPGKSWAGSIAMFLFGFLVSYGCLWYFSLMGFYQLDTRGTLLRLAVVSLAATIVESLPVSTKLDDNVTVPLTTVVVGMLLFPPGADVFGLPNPM
jgi:phytol kinase